MISCGSARAPGFSSARLLAIGAFLLLQGCALDPAIQFIGVDAGDVCEFVACGENGTCVPQADGTPRCSCNPGYTGDLCDRCESSFERDALGRCVTSRSCADEGTRICGAYGMCVAEGGVLSCACDSGYVGPRCNVCAIDHARDEFGRCLPLVFNPPGPGANDAGVLPPPSGVSCEPGYTGSGCVECAAGYHRHRGACVRDQNCGPGACPERATCSVTDGRVQCECLPGYTGPDCRDCPPGYVKVDGQCYPAQACEPGICPTRASCAIVNGFARCTCNEGWEGELCDRCTPNVRVDFEVEGGFPEDSNTCFSRGSYAIDIMTFRSMNAEADVFLCAQGTISGIATKHIVVEAGPTRFAEIAFSQPVRRLELTYGSRIQALEFDVLVGDGTDAVRSIEIPAHSTGRLELDFASPLARIRFRSRNVFRQAIGLDDIVAWTNLCQ